MASVQQVKDEVGATSNLQNHVRNAKPRAPEVGPVWMKIKMKSKIPHLRQRHQDWNFSLLNNVEPDPADTKVHNQDVHHKPPWIPGLLSLRS